VSAAVLPRWVCLDVGEVLVDETRIWSTWADVLGIPRLTFMAAIGAAVVRGGDHRDAFALLGEPEWQAREPEVQRAYGVIEPGDLYPDALPTLAALRRAGHRVAVVGNQPSRRHAELLAAGVDVDVMAMSDAIGVQKPDPRFFDEVRRLAGGIDPGEVAYVGDRVDNDVRPAAAAGMLAVWLRRGPWGVLGEDPDGAAGLTVGSLSELADLAEAGAGAPSL
jgi:HAD superfamily hydrolase (TIGR01662 family)